MKQSEVQIGKVYQVKVSGQLKPVRVEGINLPSNYSTRQSRNRYFGTVLTTGRKITLTAGKMRKELPKTQLAYELGYFQTKSKFANGKSAAANDKLEEGE